MYAVANGSLSFVNCTILRNSAGDGRMKLAFHAPNSLVNFLCLPAGNQVGGGGGVFSIAGASIMFSNCTVMGNSALGEGVYNVVFRGRAVLIRC